MIINYTDYIALINYTLITKWSSNISTNSYMVSFSASWQNIIKQIIYNSLYTYVDFFFVPIFPTFTTKKT